MRQTAPARSRETHVVLQPAAGPFREPRCLGDDRSRVEQIRWTGNDEGNFDAHEQAASRAVRELPPDRAQEERLLEVGRRMELAEVARFRPAPR